MHTLARRNVFTLIALTFMGVCLVLGGCGRKAEDQPVLRVLAWVGYEEPEFLDPIAKELGAKIEVKTYVGGDQMYSLYTSAPPGSYDVVDVDAEYGERMYREHLLRKLDESVWKAPDMFRPFESGEPTQVNGEVYAAVVRWGALGLVYNEKYVSQEEAKSYKILWSPKVNDKVVIFDWYLPNMGVFSRYLGNSTPYNISQESLQKLKGDLSRLRPQVRAIYANTGDVIGSLRSEEAWVSPGIGEWAAAVLAEEGKPINWSVPDEGGVMWVEAFAIPSSAKNQQLAEKFIELVRKPENLARLSWRKAYHSQIPLRAAYDKLSPDQRKLLKSENLNDLQSLIDRLAIRKLPGPVTDEKQWLEVWREFKVGK